MPLRAKNQNVPTEPEQIKHPVAAAVALAMTGALVAAVLSGLAKGLSTLKE